MDPLTAAQPPRRRLLLAVGALLCVLGVLAIALPVVGFVRDVQAEAIPVTGTPITVHLPADDRYGVFVDDQDNSGYSEGCEIRDDKDALVPLENPGWSLTSSDTETLDFVFDTRSGDLRISCSLSGATAVIRPAPAYDLTALGVGVGLLLGVNGAVLVGFQLTRRPRPPAP